MINGYYKQIFSDKYLSTQIFKHVQQIQHNHNSLKYDDIVDIGWMYKHNHRGLLKDKLNNSNKYLYLDGRDLFTIIANSDTKLFIRLFERYKHSVLKYYYEAGLDRVSQELNNIDVVKYLFGGGYGREIRKIRLDRIDIKVLEYYLKNQWLKPEISIFTEYQEELRRDNQTSRVDLKDKIELIVNYIQPTPNNNLYSGVDQFFSAHIETPIPGLMKSVVHLLDKKDTVQIISQSLNFNQKLTFQQAVDMVQEAEDGLIKLNTANSPSGTKTNVRRSFFNYTTLNKRLKRPEGWPSWIESFGQEFTNCWNKSASRIRVSNNEIYYHSRHDIDQTMTNEQLDVDKQVHLLSNPISSLCELNVDVQVIKFIYQQGYKKYPEYITPEFYRELVKLSSDQDRETIVQLSNSPIVFLSDYEPKTILEKSIILLSCCLYTEIDNLYYYLGKFKDNDDFDLDQNQINRLFYSAKRCAIKVLHSHGFAYTGPISDAQELYNYCCFDKFNKDRVTTLLQRLDSDERNSLLDQLVLIVLVENDYVSFKHLVGNNIIQIDIKDNEVIKLVSYLSNLNILDYINKNRSTCIKNYNEATCAQDMLSFFGMVHKMAAFKENVVLMDYLAAENCLDVRVKRKGGRNNDSPGKCIVN
ncbi:hypothetical protein CYY_004520 [Polysphondylium violaceum]|uniref:Uncharacterized protein n=1 Tax=Polysphondylium violaceum TaxID=133409 RepID=A0A8J4USY7_9MYCE|nr:hypothetical protein CYY_004520 [Polysphondylium violaceum]